jgi:hypothetical protein
MKKEDDNEKNKYEFESSVVLPTDAMGREIWWEDAGRPE